MSGNGRNINFRWTTPLKPILSNHPKPLIKPKEINSLSVCFILEFHSQSINIWLLTAGWASASGQSFDSRGINFFQIALLKKGSSNSALSLHSGPLLAKLRKHGIHPHDGAACPRKQPRSIAFPAPLILCFMYLYIQGAKRAALFLLCSKVTAASRQPQPH